MSDEEKEQTIIFIDPPYSERNIYLDVLKTLTEEPWYFGQLWIESNPEKGIPIQVLKDLKLNEDKLFLQGESYIYVTNFPQS